MRYRREDTQLTLFGIAARGFYKTEPRIHPTQCTHMLEWLIFSGDFQMSETRRIVRQIPTFVCSRGHLPL